MDKERIVLLEWLLNEVSLITGSKYTADDFQKSRAYIMGRRIEEELLYQNGGDDIHKTALADIPILALVSKVFQVVYFDAEPHTTFGRWS